MILSAFAKNMKYIVMALMALTAYGAEHRIAVIGLVHSHAWGHLPRMVSGKPATLVGVAETNPALIAEARKIGVAESLIFADYEKMLDTQKPEIVWAFVENNRHLEIARACAKRKIHLMYEKPLASTYKDALEIRALAKQAGIHVLTNYQMAWWPSNYAAKSLADSGALGQVFRLRGVVGHGGPGSEGARNQFFFEWLTDPVKNGGGALMDFGCYNALWALIEMRSHTSKGYNIMSQEELRWLLRDELPALLQHHERLDGKGYPLSEEELEKVEGQLEEALEERVN